MAVAVQSKKNEETLFDKITSLFTSKDVPVTSFLYKKVTKDGVIVDKNDNYQMFLKVKTTDLSSLSQDDFKRFFNKFTHLLRVYTEPIKISSLTYPTNVHSQISYWQYRVAQIRRKILTLDPEDTHQHKIYEAQLKIAIENIGRTNFVSTIPELTFTFTIYARNLKALQKQAKFLKNVGGRELGLQMLNQEETIKIIRKLNNMNDGQ